MVQRVNMQILGLCVAACLAVDAAAVDAPSCPDGFADTPGIPVHLSQTDIDDGTVGFFEIREHGKTLFDTVTNVCDGMGRPATDGCTQPRTPDEPLFHRLSGVDANSCAGCHNQPRSGGAGDVVMNQFFLANCLDPVATSADPETSNFRNTLGMFGSGLIEMLGIEMTADIQNALRATLPDGWNTVTTKGIDFEFLIQAGQVAGAIGLEPEANMAVSPFEQDGRITSLRIFTFNAFNVHHGLQAEELFNGSSVDRELDEDEDGLERELTFGDIAAVTIFQASMGVPTQVLPTDPAQLSRVTSGQSLFNSIGCAECHIPALTLNSAVFNDGVSPPFDMTTTGETPRAESNGSGGAIVRAYTDLKLHNLCDHEDHPSPIRTYCNERAFNDPRKDMYDWTHTLRPGTEFFITRKLWDAGSSAPYGHAGDMPTLFEAIVAHAGEARTAHDNYVALTRTEQENVVLFLKTLQAPSAEGDILDDGVVVSGP